jgi:uncharacterized Ntn-hydrolase superfamily protein
VTYSIVARDPQTRLLGVAVQTAMFAAGASVPWARAAVGTWPPRPSRSRPTGRAGWMRSSRARLPRLRWPRRRRLMRLRCCARWVWSPPMAASAMTGEWCIDHAGHLLGDGFAVQANMMASPAVWPAMAEAFGQSPEPFPRRLLAALEAGQAAGGDARGMMAAALVVVEAAAGQTPARRAQNSPI